MSDKVERFDLWGSFDTCLRDADDGDFMYHEPYEKLLSDYAALASERDALKQSIANSVIAMNALSAQSIEYVDRCAAMTANDRRYRYLRERDLGTIKRGGVFAGQTPDNVVLSGDDLDKAIDDAIARAAK